MRKLVSLALATLFALALSACENRPTQLEQTEASADAAPRSGGTFTKPTWANNHLWEFQRPQPVTNQGNGDFVFLTPSDDIAQRPFYVIGSGAGDDGKQSTLFFGAEGHDHVTTAPPSSDGEFKATVQLLLVAPAEGVDETKIAYTENTNFFTGDPIKLVYAADVDGDGNLEDFTNVTTVQTAYEIGLVKLGTTFEETVLTMRDIEG